MLAWGNRSQKDGPISEVCRRLSSLRAPLRWPLTRATIYQHVRNRALDSNRRASNQ